MQRGLAMTVSPRAMQAGLLAAIMLAAAMRPSSAADAPSALPAVFGDGAGAISRRVDNTHKARYIEIFLAAREPSMGKLVAACFNTMHASKAIPASQDTAPQALVEGLDVGKERDFNGLQAVSVAHLNMNQGGAVSESTRYKPMTIARKSGVGWNKGTTNYKP